jgi:hypothetical protein
MPLASEAMADLRPPPKETDLETTCPACGTTQRLDEATLETAEDKLETVYRCRTGDGAAILVVSTPGAVPWEGRGYRLGNWVIRNPSDLYIHISHAPPPVHMPASPHALD